MQRHTLNCRCITETFCDIYDWQEHGRMGREFQDMNPSCKPMSGFG